MMHVWTPSSKEIEETQDWGEWSKETSEFPWSYSDTETCYILEGEAIVRDNAGNELHFREGDMVRFKKGAECTWKIVRNIRKKYVFGK